MPRQSLFDDWAFDVAPSTPSPRPGVYKIPMGGFCFTEGGISVDITATEVEAMSRPPIGPTSMRGQESHSD